MKERLGRAWKGWPGRLLRISLAIVPLVWLSTRLAWREVGGELARVGWATALLALACHLTCYWLGAMRWRLLLRAHRDETHDAPIPDTATLFRHMLVAAYFNMLPGGVAGEAVRGYRVRDSVGDLATSYVVLLLDRVAGLAGLLGLAAIAAAVGPPLRSVTLDRLMLVATVAGFVLAGVALGVPFLLSRRPKVRERLVRLPGAGAHLAALRPVRRATDLLLGLLLSFGTQAAVIVGITVVLARLAPSADLLATLRVAPMVVLLVFVPLTPGGVGQREAVFSELYGLAGIPRSAAVAASIVTGMLGLVIAGVGGLTLVLEQRRARRP